MDDTWGFRRWDGTRGLGNYGGGAVSPPRWPSLSLDPASVRLRFRSQVLVGKIHKNHHERAVIYYSWTLGPLGSFRIPVDDLDYGSFLRPGEGLEELRRY